MLRTCLSAENFGALCTSHQSRVNHQSCMVPLRCACFPHQKTEMFKSTYNIHHRNAIVAASLPTVRPASEIDQMTGFLDSLKWDNNGLVVAIAQHVDTGEVLMQAFADRDAINETLQTG